MGQYFNEFAPKNRKNIYTVYIKYSNVHCMYIHHTQYEQKKKKIHAHFQPQNLQHLALVNLHSAMK